MLTVAGIGQHGACAVLMDLRHVTMLLGEDELDAAVAMVDTSHIPFLPPVAAVVTPEMAALSRAVSRTADHRQDARALIFAVEAGGRPAAVGGRRRPGFREKARLG